MLADCPVVYQILDAAARLWDWSWAFANSSFFSSFLAAIAGAFAGAYGAQWIVERTQRQRRLLEEIRNTNAATMAAFSCTNTFLGVKDQQVRPLRDTYRHDIVKLHRDVVTLYKKLSLGMLEQPQALRGIPWHRESVETFIGRVNKDGDPNNRYMQYGYVLRQDDLFKLDQVIWHIRRYCRPFYLTFRSGGKTKRLKWIKRINSDPTQWSLAHGLPLERTLRGEASPAARQALLTLNVPFAPHRRHLVRRWRTASANPPLAEHFMLLRSPNAAPTTRRTARETLKWVYENIQLSRTDREMIKNSL